MDLEGVPDWAKPLALDRRVFAIAAWHDAGDGHLIEPEHIGSGFFLSPGDFITAKHLVEPYQQRPEMLTVFLPSNDGAPRYIEHTVQDVAMHETCDFAFCRIKLRERARRPLMTDLSLLPLTSDDEVVVFGFGGASYREFEQDGQLGMHLSLRPHAIEVDVVQHHPHGIIYAKGPSYELANDVPGGHSGAPLFARRTGAVHAIICSGGICGTATDIRCFADLVDYDFLEAELGPELAHKLAPNGCRKG